MPRPQLGTEDGQFGRRPSHNLRSPIHPLVVDGALHTARTSPAHFPSGDGHPRPIHGSFANHRNLDPRMSTSFNPVLHLARMPALWMIAVHWAFAIPLKHCANVRLPSPNEVR
jgi:hypothetical protein